MLFIIFVCTSFAGQTIAKKAGLGDTFTDIEALWNKGYKKESPARDGVKNVEIGTSEGSYISYSTGVWGYTFGKPERAGRLAGNAKGLFGALHGQNPTKQQFFNGIRDLMPKDFTLTGAYERIQSYKKGIYIFKSQSLVKLPDIKNSFRYTDRGFGSLRDRGDPVGSFSLIVTYDIDNKDKVAAFILFLGRPGSTDMAGMKKVTANPFK